MDKYSPSVAKIIGANAEAADPANPVILEEGDDVEPEADEAAPAQQE